MKKIITLCILAVAGLLKVNAQYVMPTNLTGNTPSQIPWSTVATGTSLPIRSSTTTANGQPGAVAYYSVSTGELLVDPKGWDISLINFTYRNPFVSTSGQPTNVSGSTPGPFVFSCGYTTNGGAPQCPLDGSAAYPGNVSPANGPKQTLPAGPIQLITAFQTRLAAVVNLNGTPTMATTGDPANIASTNGWFNLPWSFGNIVQQDSLTSIVPGNWTVSGVSAHLNANILGYGNYRGVFQYTINGVTGNQVGAIIPFTPCTPTTTTFTTSACGSYTWPVNGQTYTASGTYTLPAVNCVINQLVLTINPQTIYYADTDGDTYGNASSTLASCTGAPAGYVANNSDCNDGNAAINPGAAEVCNGVDDNCSGSADEGLTFQTYYADADGDGFGAGTGTSSCAPIAGSVTTTGDCNNNNASINPGAAEICNGVDDNCSGSADEGLTFQTYYADADGDGFGAGTGTSSCAPIGGSVTTTGDCNNNNASINPGAAEVCNGVDDNCNGSADEGLIFQTYYADADGDGFGAGAGTSSCAPIAGSVTVDGDCNNNNAAVNPGAAEVCGNQIDDDCDGLVDEGCASFTYYADADGDGFGNALVFITSATPVPPAGYVSNSGDCNDSNAAINPGAAEVCNGVDDNCSGSADEGLTFQTYYADVDGDGYGSGAGTSSCAPIAGSVTVDGDCNNNNAAVNPGAAEVCGNLLDDDCDGLVDEGCASFIYYADADGDGFGNALVFITSATPVPPAGYVSNSGDCNDSNAAINPGVAEVCNGVDDDCDGIADDGLTFVTYYADVDGDTYGNSAMSQSTCNGAPAGYVTNNGDCNDNNAAVNPNAAEVCNGVDDDCDGIADDGLTFVTYYADADGDTYGNAGMSQSTCNGAPAGYVTSSGDCNDNNAAVNPAATEVCNGIDDDCDGLIDENVVVAGAISGPAKQCVAVVTGSATFSIATVAGATDYNWSVPTGMTIISGQGTNSIFVSWSPIAAGTGITGNMSVTASNTCGAEATSTVLINIVYTEPVTPPSISGPVKLCPGDVATYSISPVARASSYNWSLPAGVSITSGAGSNVITVAVSGSYTGGVLSVSALNSCGTSPARVRTLMLNPLPAPSAISGQSTGLCGVASAAYSCTAVVGANSYLWSVPSGASIVSGAGTNSIVVSFSGSFGGGTITAQAVNNCGNGSARTLTVSGAPGQPGVISGDQTICPGQASVPYSIATVAGTNVYTWTIPGIATLVSGQGTKDILVNWSSTPASGQGVSVTAANSCGASPVRSLNGITVNAANCRLAGFATEQTLTIYPNPASEQAMLQFSAAQAGDYRIRITDLAGRVVFIQDANAGAGVNNIALDLSSYAAGMYTVQLDVNGEQQVTRMMVE